MKKRDLSAKTFFLRYELLLFACVFLLIIGILAYTNYSYQRNLENTTGTTVHYYINSKEEMMSNVEHVLFNIAANDYSFQNIAYTTDRTQAYFSAYQVKEKLSTLLDNTAILDGFGIYTENNFDFYSCIYRPGISWQEREVVKEYMTRKLHEAPDELLGKWSMLRLENEWYMVQTLGYHGLYCFCIIRAESMVEQEISASGERSYMLLAKDGILLSYEELEEICGLDLKNFREAYVTDKNYYVLRQEMEKADCSVLSVSKYNGIMDLKSGLVLFVVLFCIFLSFLILLQRYLNKNIVYPTRVMVDTMNAIQKGDSQKRMPMVGSIREYRVIQERFNKMIDQVSELRNIALERLIQINRITLQYYERQIRPHFFLNCLKNIFGMSTTGDKEKIQEYILVLSNYLRFAFQNHRSLIPLKEELQGVDDYIRLQQMTMQNPIQYYEEIESGLEEFQIPPISILTFVENSVRYLHPEERIPEIRIHIRRLTTEQESMVNICIMDNGSGFDAEMLEKLNASEEKLSNDHIGIKNVQQRFQLISGEKCTFSYTNRNGACVDLYIPYQKRQADYLEDLQKMR